MSLEDLIRQKSVPLGERTEDAWIMVAQARGLRVGEAFQQAPPEVTCGYSWFTERWGYVRRCRVTLQG